MKRDDYIKLFPNPDIQREALKYAHDIRKFEIELYWKRATYFWTILAAIFAGYFLLTNASNTSHAYAVACLGVLFSVAWYLVNRASSAWQRNWEAHVDLLEDAISGPLHKTTINRRRHRFRDLIGPYSTSPSRINTTLSLAVVAVWLVLVVRQLIEVGQQRSDLAFAGAITTVLAAFLIVLVVWCRSGGSSDKPRTLDVETRRYE